LEEVGADMKRAVVIGGGIAGIQASLDLADRGFEVHLVEKSPSIGGHMAQLDKTFPTNDCSMCILSPKMIMCADHANIKLHTYSEVEGVSGDFPKFKVTQTSLSPGVSYFFADICFHAPTLINHCFTVKQ